MPQVKPSIWRLHWPSWLALIAISSTFVMLNVLVNFTLKGANTGWPLRTCRIAAIDSVGDPHWIWSVKLPNEGSRPPYAWQPTALAVNATIGFVVMLLSVVGVEGYCRRHEVRLSLRAVFFGTAVTGSALAILAPARFPAFTFNSGFVGSLLAVMCLATALASLGALDLIAIVVSRVAGPADQDKAIRRGV